MERKGARSGLELGDGSGRMRAPITTYYVLVSMRKAKRETHVTVAVDVFCQRVENNVRTERKRGLVIGRHEGIVDE